MSDILTKEATASSGFSFCLNLYIHIGNATISFKLFFLNLSLHRQVSAPPPAMTHPLIKLWRGQYIQRWALKQHAIRPLTFSTHPPAVFAAQTLLRVKFCCFYIESFVSAKRVFHRVLVSPLAFHAGENDLTFSWSFNWVPVSSCLRTRFSLSHQYNEWLTSFHRVGKQLWSLYKANVMD